MEIHGVCCVYDEPIPPQVADDGLVEEITFPDGCFSNLGAGPRPFYIGHSLDEHAGTIADFWEYKNPYYGGRHEVWFAGHLFDWWSNRHADRAFKHLSRGKVPASMGVRWEGPRRGNSGGVDRVRVERAEIFEVSAILESWESGAVPSAYVMLGPPHDEALEARGSYRARMSAANPRQTPRPATNERELQETFEEYGPVRSVQVITDRETGQSKGFGFVEFDSHEDAQAAILGADGKVVGGRGLRVSEARPRGDRG